MIKLLLQSFSTFSQAQMMFFSFIIFTLVYGSIKLRSVVSMVSTSLTVIVLVGIMQFDLALNFFWYMLILNVIAIAVSVIVSVQYQ